MKMTTERLPNIHPGEIVREEFLVPLGKSAYWLAKGLGITESAVSEILKGKRAITPATALKLERFLGCSAEFWLGLQAAYDLEEERRRLAPGLEEMEPADLDAAWKERARALEARKQQMVSALPGERVRLAGELATMAPRESVSA
jgi:antitoxin HigA-1